MLPCLNCTIHDPNARLSSFFHGNYHASIHAVALACPGVDYIKLWPMEQPWQERLIRCRMGMRGDEAPPDESGGRCDILK